MIKILFVCHGNICRSPMGEFIMKDLVHKARLQGEFEIASAATSREEIGSPVYPPARQELLKHGISCEGKRARQVVAADVDYYDRIYYMGGCCRSGPVRSSPCWIGMWQTPGTPGISPKPGRISWRAVKIF